VRINKYLALKTGISRRGADAAIEAGRVSVNGQAATAGQQIAEIDIVTLDGQPLEQTVKTTTIMLNKPVGYVCSRDGQGNRTIYDLLPAEMHHLKPVGRLDKHSSGLILMTNDGQLAYELTHPKFQKLKKYKIALNKDLSDEDYETITGKGAMLEDGISRFDLEMINNQPKEWKVEMREGRNRQIRRTFELLGYNVVKLHRTHFGPYLLGSLPAGKTAAV
jgi:23S rRNA pseudouridine2605 synthase